ncbi:RDD family protein [Streptomyces solicathayae]|uniref:RDD family protein n=1 Tax=Streptomyces solicathayae TaxID=3081768 RepID=A0ABZ0M4H4_9ACTN|nr:RDD family protein [Streptomyces sp. HUAS YS2]WOX26331.1 RDD family protein [Streptomyces sp. HUAS YS2]
MREIDLFNSMPSGGDLGRFQAASGARAGSPAGLMPRCAATAIDLVIGVAVILVPLVGLDRILTAAGVADGEAGVIWLATAALWVAAFFLLYSPLSVSRWGATPGKRALRLEVVRFETGERIGYGSAFARHLTNLAVTGIPVLCVANLSAINLSKDRRGMHDKAAGSAVIHRR